MKRRTLIKQQPEDLTGQTVSIFKVEEATGVRGSRIGSKTHYHVKYVLTTQARLRILVVTTTDELGAYKKAIEVLKNRGATIA